MATKPTVGEILHKLVESNATLVERVESTRAALARLEAAQSRTAETLTGIRERLAVVEERLNELKKAYEEGGRKRWLVVVATVGCLLTFLGNLYLTFWRK